MCGDLERATGAGGGLLEKQRDVLAGLDVGRQLQQEPEVIRAEVEFLDETAAEQVDCHVAPQASRSIGQVMQCEPPLPRPSSLPLMVITSMPLRRRNVFVVTLRSYETTTLGWMAKTLHPSSHCSRSAVYTSWVGVRTLMSSRPSAAAIALCMSAGG